MPYAKDGSSTTTFLLPSAAYVDFIEGFAEDELEATQGYLEGQLLDDLILRIRAYDEEQTAGQP